MKLVIIVAVLAVVGFGGYKLAFASSGAYEAYESFADAILYDRWDDAKKACTSGSARDFVDAAESLPKKMGYETYKYFRGIVHMGPSRKLESETKSADGKTVTLRVIQEVRRGSPTMAPIGKATVRQKQDVVVADTPDGWRVQGFKEEVESLTEM